MTWNSEQQKGDDRIDCHFKWEEGPSPRFLPHALTVTEFTTFLCILVCLWSNLKLNYRQTMDFILYTEQLKDPIRDVGWKKAFFVYITPQIKGRVR
jgi:hypothetical protein